MEIGEQAAMLEEAGELVSSVSQKAYQDDKWENKLTWVGPERFPSVRPYFCDILWVLRCWYVSQTRLPIRAISEKNKVQRESHMYYWTHAYKVTIQQ